MYPRSPPWPLSRRALALAAAVAAALALLTPAGPVHVAPATHYADA
ncbi:hypothetical protein [Sphingomonas profundi]|nr:hypothetical protein [Sphingomonas profundi]